MLPPIIIRHRISNKEKYANNGQWAKDFLNRVIPSFTKNSAYTQLYGEMLSNYRLYNNILDQSEFERVCNYYGIDVNQYQDEILPYNKTYGKINVLCGEELKRGEEFKGYLVTDAAMRKKDEQYKKKISEYVDAEIALTLQQMAMKDQNMPEDEINKFIEETRAAITPKDIDVKYFKSDLEIFLNHILHYAMYDQKIKQQKNMGWKHFLISDLEMVYVGIIKGKPTIKVLNSLNTFYHKGPETMYIQDSDWAGQRFVMTREEILDTYGDIMDEDDLKKFEKRYFPRVIGSQLTNKIDPQFETTMKYRELHSLTAQGQIYDGVGSHTSDKSYTQQYDFVEVVHCEFRSQREIGILTYFDEYGTEKLMAISEEYKIPEYAQKVKFTNAFGNDSVKWEWSDENGRYKCVEYLWLPRIWEATRIDGDIFVNVREKPNQPFNINDPYRSAKLGYCGFVGHDTNAKSLSIMGRMKPFQFLFFIAMHQLNHLIAKNIGPVTIYDLAQLPDFKDPAGRDNMELVLFYLQKGLAFSNSMQNTQGGQMPASRGAGINQMNLSSTVDIINLTQVLEYLNKEIGLAAGIAPERESQFSNNTNVTDNQQAITQSMHITEILFSMHNEFWKEVLTQYVDCFRQWMSNFFEAHPTMEDHMLNYVLPDGSVELFKVTPDVLSYAEMGIFVGNSGQSENYRMQMQQMLQPMIQNQMQGAEALSSILKGIISGDSPETIDRTIRAMSEDQRKQAQMAEENKKQMLREQLDAQRAQLEMQAGITKDIDEAKETARRLTELMKIAATTEATLKVSAVDKEIEQMRLDLEKEIENKKLEIERKQQQIDKEIDTEKLAVERIKANKPKNSTK